MPANDLSPFDLLDQQAQRSIDEKFLPNRKEIRERWSGVGFRVNGIDLLTPLDEVFEVVDIPVVVKVPGVKSWVKGLANMRGNLLPVFDLTYFLFGKVAQIDSRSRLLVLHQGEVYVGLIVDLVSGMKNFWLEERSTELPTIANELSPYMQGSCKRSGEHLPVFSLAKLARHEAFLAVTA